MRQDTPKKKSLLSDDETVSRGIAAFDQLREIAARNGLSGMSLDDINEEIRQCREDDIRRRSEQAQAALDDIQRASAAEEHEWTDEKIIDLIADYRKEKRKM